MSGKVEKIFKPIFFFILLLNSQFFLIPQISQYFQKMNTYHNKILITVLSLILLIIWLINSYQNIRLSWLDFFVLSFMVFTTILFFLQIVVNKERAIDLISNYYYTLIIVIYFPLSRFLFKDENMKWLLNSIISIGALYILGTIILYLLISNGIGTVVASSTTLIHYVNAILRLPQTSDLIGFTLLSILIKLKTIDVSPKKRLALLALLGVSMYVLFFISNVRMVFLTCLILILFSVLQFIIKNFNSISKIILWIMFSFLLLYIIVKFELLQQFIGDGQKSASVFYRFKVIDYFKSHFFDNIVFGFGYSDSVRIIYSITDIGLLGFIFKYGLIGLLWGTALSILLIKETILSDSKVPKLILIYLIVTGISLSIFDSQRMLYLPILLAIFKNSRKVFLNEKI